MSDLPPPQFPPPEPPTPGSTPINEVVERTSVVEGNEPWFKKKIAKVPAWGWIVAVVVLIGAAIGIGAGAWVAAPHGVALAHRLSGVALSRVFALALALVGVALLRP